MSSLSPRSNMSDAPEVTPTSAKSAEQHPLDVLTGGAFSAETSGDRSARIRDWLATQPNVEQLQDVFKELSVRDKGAARAVRERLDEIRRTKDQEKIAVEWGDKAQALLAASPFNMADAVAWQREAAKAGAPLSREPLSLFKAQLAERIKAIEDLQHRVQVQREVAVLLAQRIEVLSTKPWRDAQSSLDSLRADVARWQEQAQELTGDTSWPSVDGRFPPQMEVANAQLNLVWDAFQSALQQTEAAAADTSAELPPVPVWADELRVARGLPPETAAAGASPKAAAPARAAAVSRTKPSAGQVEAAALAMGQALKALQADITAGEAQAGSANVLALRAAIKAHGRHVDDALANQVHEALLAAGEADGWARQNADKLREELVAKAEALLNRPEGQALGGRKIQESLRALREQWKLADQGSASNHGLWKKFDEACNAAHKVVEAWHEKVRGDASQAKAQRLALIEEIKAWGAEQGESQDWKGMARSLRQFAERWREGGHVGEKLFAELQPLFRQAMTAAEAPLHAAQKTSLNNRHAMIDEAVALGAADSLRIDAVKSLQQRWQAEAQAVPLDRKHEQKLWDAFRKPLDEAFNRKGAERGGRGAPVDLSEHDRLVLDASKAVQEANASGDVQRIRSAVAALEEALRGQAQQQQAAAAPQTGAADQVQAEEGGEPVAKPAAVRPVVAVRGDDRPGMKKDSPAAPGRPARPGERRDAGGRGRPDAPRGPAGRNERGGDRGDRFPREDRGPRLADPAFRAQREAMEHAQETLRKLAAQAHGEALTQLLSAWEARDTSQLPGAQELGGRVSPQVRSAWSQALAAQPQGDAQQALLRLEMAADVPTPAEHMNARRALQLQLLTRRNDPSPQETWGQDAAQVLASPRDEVKARRLQNVLKNLMRK